MRKNAAVANATSILCLLLSGAVASAATPAHRTYRSHRYASAFNPAKDDATDYDEPEVRELAIAALGHEKGSVVAVDPSNGRILTIVDQRMAFGSGFEPCSTIKLDPLPIGQTELSARQGFGLSSMRQRASAIGGEWQIASEPGHGTRVSVRLLKRAS